MALDRFFRRRRPQQQAGTDLPDLWTQCPACKEGLYNRELEQEAYVCPRCGHHFRLSAERRVEVLADPGSFRQLSGQVHPVDPLHFTDTEPYPERLRRAQAKTGRPDAILTGTATLHGLPVTLAVMDFAFSGGSMGSVVGEEIARAAEYAAESRTPLLLVAASGGARMQESALSLMQMAKTTVALEALSGRGVPYLSLLTDPTTGGVTASFATIADVIIAEPGALIGFAGPRVIQQTIRQNLPEGFQRAEFLLEHGMVDNVVDRREQRRHLAGLLGVLTRQEARL
ncbi:acetyl-CoA carboxylase, carboxyltransferase subunit beta [Deinococcus radiodurans]|jgi:acetyl-CoA carboxylase carboxyltransferase subunit alpha|uniref:Acetyl-coenzyme A carboxylase carboxyl transferase subunit beta n=1 Tax=Deinococcus radiodurans (strain ATCC 13939 / DSM 20539 / JCM 16871 / CCUG 27074 / LMG 4051 / NBRC 15346 / NCIMB 9279 / VKM B-1422 / R1) TaxID=243230 RepID=Q9RV15_DEIRA|nr:acetyl-CoA carboxylase, carboxyltransferase subunit beta [Deinococcus radiodurans]AAF10788.1 acetyl-CoA carboxylase carboxyl transferase, beta subunit [Deinococcus radiodurans R1 = ATCC 13939 = DSM 20539]ANC71619.1 acetyl-CoA carboxylase carboxyl transferase subunit beta [Deinococcus radiodurans R1 = ATCC 13939 = DSM 20539]QEM70690.1 acetyl-CoA carboxylase carboxyltransferase subunit beta [Deinococcus radiodurans]QIP29287.1 acetyl-CoA carboxylase carboxyltransferase subunit beta [Deinococcus